MQTWYAVVKEVLPGQKGPMQIGTKYPDELRAREHAERRALAEQASFFVLKVVGVVGPVDRPVDWRPIEDALPAATDAAE